MRYKEIAGLIVLGLILGGLALWITGSSSSSININAAPDRTGGASPQSEANRKRPRFDPDTVGRPQFVFEKVLTRDTLNGAFASQSTRAGQYVLEGKPVSLNVNTQAGTLGLIVDARAATPPEMQEQGLSALYREGIHLKKEIPRDSAPTLRLKWDGQLLHEFVLGRYSWNEFYCPVAGDGKPHQLKMELVPPNNGSDAVVAVRAVRLFSQNAGQFADRTRIGLPEARLRAKALNRKIVVVGLDGISWRIVSPLIQQGKMPHLEQLIRNGVSAVIKDEPPLDSPKIWTTVATGRHPSAHGLDQRVYPAEGGGLVAVNSTMRKVPALWNIFSEMGRTVGFVNWFITWPAEPVNGFIVSDRLQLDAARTVYPEIIGEKRSEFLTQEPDLSADKGVFAEHVKRLLSLREQGDYPTENYMDEKEFHSLVDRIEEVYYNDRFIREYGIDLYKEFHPDLFALYFHGTDAISHAFYKFRFPEDAEFAITPEQVEKVGDPIESVYRFHDRTLGMLKAVADPETVWVVLSDHGFQAQYPVDIERVLSWDLNSLLEPLGLLERDEKGEIDWSKTVCYTNRQLSWNPVAWVKLNLEGREPTGIVPPDKAEQETEKVIEKIRSIVFTDSGKPVFRVVYPEDAEKNQCDFQVRPWFDPEDFSRKVSVGKSVVPVSDLFTVVPISGNHNIEGVFVLSGPGIRSGIKLDEPVRTVDVAPTILALAGLPVAEDFDGRIIERALQEKFMSYAPLRSIRSYDFPRVYPVRNNSRQYSDMEDMLETDKEFIQRQKDWGYL